MLVEVGGQLAYVAHKQVMSDEPESMGDTKECVIYSGEQMGRCYDSVKGLTAVDGKPAFVATNGEDTFVVRGEEAIRELNSTVNSPIVAVGGRLAYKVSKNGEEVLVVNGQEIGQGYDFIDPRWLATINGSVAYRAEDDGEEFIVFRGDRRGEQYAEVAFPRNAGGELAYVGGNETGTLGENVVVYGGETLGEQYDGVYWEGWVVNGVPAFIARQDENEVVVVGGSEQGSYDRVPRGTNAIQDVNGRPVYVAREGGNSFVVYGEKAVRNGYDFVLAGPIEVNGKLVFAAERNGSIYLVQQQ